MASSLNYLIVGTGGVGGSIAAFLSLAGCRVGCIARGAALEAMRSRGLVIHSDIKGDHTLRIPAYSTEDYAGKADVIFVTVKGYSIDSVADVIMRASHPGTIVIPVLNVYGTGARISALTPGGNVLDGCIYIVGFKSGVGEISQMGRVFHLVFGVPRGRTVDPALLDTVCRDLTNAGIKTTLSDDIDRDTFIKWSFISAMALTGAYYDIPMGPIQHPGPERDTFIALSRESAALGRSLGIDLGPDPVGHHLAVIDALDPASTASMQKDLKAGHQSEIQGLLHDMIARAQAQGIPTPTYHQVAARLTGK